MNNQAKNQYSKPLHNSKEHTFSSEEPFHRTYQSMMGSDVTLAMQFFFINGKIEEP